MHSTRMWNLTICVLSSENDGCAQNHVQLSERVFKQDSKIRTAYISYWIDFVEIILTDSMCNAFYVKFLKPTLIMG